MTNQVKDFDALLSSACAARRAQELAAYAALTPQGENLRVLRFAESAPDLPRHRKRMAALAVVAAAMLLLALGVGAIWPRLDWTRENGRLRLGISDAPAGEIADRMQFGYLPNGFVIEWLGEAAEVGYSQARITYTGRHYTGYGDGWREEEKSFVVTQYSFDISNWNFDAEDGDHRLSDEITEIQEIVTLHDSAQEIETEEILSARMVYWTTPNACYRFYTESLIEDSAEAEEILQLLQKIEP